MKRIIPLLTFVSLAAGCATTSNPPQASGKLRPVNSLATAEMLEHDAGYLIVGPQRADTDVREQLLYQGMVLEGKPAARQRQFSRSSDPGDFALVPGAELIERTVVVTFPFASTRFSPDTETRWRLRQLLAIADRVEIRGRTDGKGDPEANQRTALRRAEAAKRYLLDRGVPSNIMAINYQAAGDYIADDHHKAGRNQNRRVEIEFFVDDFTSVRQGRAINVEPSLADQGWQEVTGK